MACGDLNTSKFIILNVSENFKKFSEPEISLKLKGENPLYLKWPVGDLNPRHPA